jgi:hypothetical protein
MLNFPSTPALGDQYTIGTRTWAFNGAGWERIINSRQVLLSFVLIDLLIIDQAIAFNAPLVGFTELNYI